MCFLSDEVRIICAEVCSGIRLPRHSHGHDQQEECPKDVW